MDYVAARQPETRCDARLAGRTRRDAGTRRRELRAGSAMDGTAHAASGYELGIRGVHDRVDGQRRDVDERGVHRHLSRLTAAPAEHARESWAPRSRRTRL